MPTAAGNKKSFQEAACYEGPIVRAVLGIGNILLTDDGVGVAVAEFLRDDLSGHGIKVIDGGTLGYSLLPLIEDATGLVAVDAGQFGGQPGAVKVFEGTAMDEYLERASSGTVHEVSLRDLLDMARLRDALPGRRALVAIQPQSVDWGNTLSPPVAKAVPAAADAVRRILEAWQ